MKRCSIETHQYYKKDSVDTRCELHFVRILQQSPIISAVSETGYHIIRWDEVMDKGGD